jgi:cytochrome c oxidase assembly protein subunit 15
MTSSPRALTYWLMASPVIILMMVCIGGLTRLTGSGLSMVDWRPLTGWWPPLSVADWQAVFALYKSSPQYMAENNWMSLSDFKGIFWLEYLHRLFGRFIGLWLLGGTCVFWRYLSTFQKRGLLITLVLTLCQGVMGWYMVKSGLLDNPAVSPYRLTAHLLLALTIFTGLIIVQQNRRPRLSFSQKSIGGLLLITITYGGFMAGSKAGFVYNTFPLMDKSALPMHISFGLFFEHQGLIQIIHRTLAALTWLFMLCHALYGPYTTNQKLCLISLVSAQFILGIITLLWVVPLFLGTLHQVWAFVLWGGFLNISGKKQTV